MTRTTTRGIPARGLAKKAWKQYSRAVSVVAAGIVALVVAFPTPAHATLGLQPQWRNFPQLEQNLYWNTNLVKLWQLIVQSDIDTGKTCTQFADGQFGGGTDTRTRTWQSTFSIGVDGDVGPQTWSTAQGHLRLDNTSYVNAVNNGWGTKNWTYYYYYVGKRSSFYISFAQADHYQSGVYTYTSYDPWQFKLCGQSYWVTVSW
jgi:peptidoglycan hydrolase-like protein with peptidoglycan-binding domain